MLRPIARPLEVFKNHSCVFEVLGFPLALENYHPGERLASALLQYVPQERLGVANEGDLGPGESQPFPEKPHQPITLRAVSVIALAARSEN